MSASRRLFAQYAKRLAREFQGRVQERVGMKRHTTFRIGGMAELMVWPRDLADLSRAVELAKEMEAPWRILGHGSNLLVGDAGVAEVLIQIKDAFPAIEEMGEEAGGKNGGTAGSERTPGSAALVRFEAGVRLPAAVKRCQTDGLAGLEWAAGIPGSMGGAVIMNAGSMGKSMSDVIEWVEWFRPGRGVERVERKDLAYEYRRLTRPRDAAVVACGLRLVADDPRAIRERIVKGLKRRRQTQPLTYPSAGSVFKNPKNDYAGRLIEAAGLKGFRIGDAQISDLHANFIVNRGRARSREVKALIDKAREEIRKASGLELELEIELIGEELS
ncbi:MAG TPA: UDP-N-acetylmuramate dehydrogenase [bacterium]|nr:UDP-N-acetylmuramate dehydrogenase [bacterium]